MTTTLARRRRLAGYLPAAALLGVLTCAAAAAVVQDWPARRYLLFYLAPIGAAFPLWLRQRLLDPEARPAAAVALDGVVVALAGLRFLGALFPASGHMLFLSYAGLTTRGAAFRALALVLALETTYFKLVLWRDARSWWVGLAAGGAAALLHRILVSRHPPA